MLSSHIQPAGSLPLISVNCSVLGFPIVSVGSPPDIGWFQQFLNDRFMPPQTALWHKPLLSPDLLQEQHFNSSAPTGYQGDRYWVIQIAHKNVIENSHFHIELWAGTTWQSACRWEQRHTGMLHQILFSNKRDMLQPPRRSYTVVPLLWRNYTYLRYRQGQAALQVFLPRNLQQLEFSYS